jgi:hypothetical protein
MSSSGPQAQSNPATREQIAKCLPELWKMAPFQTMIATMKLYDLSTGGKLPDLTLPHDPENDATLQERFLAITDRLARPGSHTLSDLKPLWDGILKFIKDDATKVTLPETASLYDCLVAFENAEELPKYQGIIYLNAKHRWLPYRKEMGASPVTIFVRGGGTGDGSPEPGRLGIFEEGPRLFMRLDSKKILENCYSGNCYRVGVFHGASGSGKTSAMLTAAVLLFEAKVVMHLRGVLIVNNIPGGLETLLKCTGTTDRNQTVLTAILKVLLEYEPIESARRLTSKGSSQETVAIVLDEMGDNNLRPILRAICANREKIAESIAKSLRVQQVVLLCGGTGLDTVDSKETGLLASNRDDYFVVSDFGVQASHWLSWLLRQGKAGELVHRWLRRKHTHLCRLADDLLTNCRSAAFLVKFLLAEVRRLSKDCELVKPPFTIEHVMPNEILQCIVNAVTEFKRLNGLSDVDHVRAAELIREAVALQMCAVKDDLKLGETDLLLTKFGILTDTWAGLETSTRQSRAQELGVPRYRISRALVTMGRLGVGRFTARLGADPWSSWEDDTCRFFATLARSAMVMKKLGKCDDSAANLLLPTASLRSKAFRGFEFVEDQTLSTMKLVPSKVQCIPMISKEWVFYRDRKSEAFVSRSLTAPLQPKMTKFALKEVITRIKISLRTCNFLVLKNAPLANYADVVCVNKLNGELWLIQCKFSKVRGGVMKVDWKGELEKMGYGRRSDAVTFTQTLSEKLGLNAQRYFLCLAHLADRSAPTIPSEYRDAPNIHVLEHPWFDFGALAPEFRSRLDSWMDADTWAPAEPPQGSCVEEVAAPRSSKRPRE